MDRSTKDSSPIRGGVLRKTVTEPDVKVRDYLAESLPRTVNERVSKHRLKQRALRDGCSHPRLKQFTFTEGKALDGSIIKSKTIKMCPDCTTFDARRHSALCKGQALKTCTTIESPIINEEFARVHRDKSLSFDGKYEGPTSDGGRDVEERGDDYVYLTLLPSKKTKKDPACAVWGIGSFGKLSAFGKPLTDELSGFVYSIGGGIPTTRYISSRDDLTLNQTQWAFCRDISVRRYKGADVREPALTYSKSVLINKDGALIYNPIGVRLKDRERKARPEAPKPFAGTREVAERTTQPTKYVAKVEPEWIVKPLPCTKLVKETRRLTAVEWCDLHRFDAAYMPARHEPRVTGQDLKPVIAPAPMWWPELHCWLDATFGERVGSRRCLCDECTKRNKRFLRDDEVIEEVENKKNRIVYWGTAHDLIPIELMGCTEMPRKVKPEGDGPDD